MPTSSGPSSSTCGATTRSSPARDLLARAEQRSAGDPLPVAITFDDDFSRHTTIAAPLLSEFGFRATFFLCGNTLEGPDPFWWQDLQVILNRDLDAWPKLRRRLAQDWQWAELEGQVSDFTNTMEAAPPKLRDEIAAKLREIAGDDVLDPGLRADEVRELARDFDIGFHTRRHYRLETLEGKALDEAMREGLDELTEVVGHRPATIAYPHAKADLRVADAARGAGFELGFLVGDVPTTAAQHPLLLARVGGATDSLETFRWVLGQAANRA